MLGALTGQATPARQPLFAPALTTWLLILSSIALLALSVLAAASLGKLDTKLPPYQTVQVHGIRDAAVVSEMAKRLSEAQPLSRPQLDQLTWFLRQCGTTVLKGASARAADEPRSSDELPVMNCGIDLERGTQWYELGSGVIEIGPKGPVYVPEYGDWSIEYAERFAPAPSGQSAKTQRIARVTYSNLPDGVQLWTELPATTAIAWEKEVAPHRVSWPVLVSLAGVILPGMAIGLLGLSAWRPGSMHRTGAVLITLWALGLTAIWTWAILDLQAVENFVDALKHSRPNPTLLPRILAAVVAAWVFTLAYWLHLPIGLPPRERPTQSA